MSLADTFGISGVDKSPWAQLLYLISAMAVLGLIAVRAGTLWKSRAWTRRAIADP